MFQRIVAIDSETNALVDDGMKKQTLTVQTMNMNEIGHPYRHEEEERCISSLPPFSQRGLVCQVHGVGLLTHSLHPPVDELAVFLLEPVSFLFRHGEL